MIDTSVSLIFLCCVGEVLSFHVRKQNFSTQFNSYTRIYRGWSQLLYCPASNGFAFIVKLVALYNFETERLKCIKCRTSTISKPKYILRCVWISHPISLFPQNLILSVSPNMQYSYTETVGQSIIILHRGQRPPSGSLVINDILKV